MSILDEALICLVGPIDHLPDDGVGFRQEIKHKIIEAGLKVRFFDPTNKPVGGFKEIGHEKNYAFNLRAEGRFKELKAFVHAFRRQDLRAVHVSDIVVAYVDPDVHMCGSYNEILVAEQEDKPRLAVIKGGVRRCPLWLFDVFGPSDMFDDINSLVARLTDIDSGKHPFDPTWLKASVLLEGNERGCE